MSQLRTTTSSIRPGHLRVALVDDHEVIAAAVREALWLAPELVLVTAAPTVDALLARGVDPLDLVVLDLRLQEGSSPQRNVARLTAAGYPVVAFTSGEDAHLLRAAARTPVLGILCKSEPVSVITAALIRAAHGSPVMTPEWPLPCRTIPSAQTLASPRRNRAFSPFSLTATAALPPQLKQASPHRPSRTTSAASARSTHESAVPRPPRSTSTNALWKTDSSPTQATPDPSSDSP